MNLETITAPAYWAPALINGDFSGITTLESIRLNQWRKINRVRAVLALAAGEDGADQEERFTWSYRLYDPEAKYDGGSVLDFVCDVSP